MAVSPFKIMKTFFCWLILFATLLAGVRAANAQPGPVSIRPDCFQFFTFTATGNSNVFDNRSAGCPYFAIAYSSNGFSVLSLVVQTAPDAGGTPGAFSTYTANSGINPNTAITQAFSTFSGYFPWLRVQLTSVTGSGSISGVLYGWKAPPDIIAGGGSSGGCVGTSATPCVVVGSKANGANVSAVPPILIEGIDYTTNHGIALEVDNSGALLYQTTINTLVDGTSNTATPTQSTFGAPYFFQVMPSLFNGVSWDRQYVCANQAFVNLAASGNAQIIAASGSTVIRVCHIHLSTSAPETIQLTTGTGANCGTGNAVIDAYQNTSSLAMDFQPTAALRTAASQALCINPSTNTTLTGVIIYAQY